MKTHYSISRLRSFVTHEIRSALLKAGTLRVACGLELALTQLERLQRNGNKAELAVQPRVP